MGEPMRSALVMLVAALTVAAGGCSDGRDGSLTYIDAAVDAEVDLGPDTEPDPALPDMGDTDGEADADG